MARSRPVALGGGILEKEDIMKDVLVTKYIVVELDDSGDLQYQKFYSEAKAKNHLSETDFKALLISFKDGDMHVEDHT
jgi:hypothetical protein